MGPVVLVGLMIAAVVALVVSTGWLMDPVVLVGLLIVLVTGLPVLRQLRSHPPGLRVLFAAEMWERFSYYGMRNLLVFFFAQHYLLAEDHAQLLYASYTSLVYVTPLIGGWLADRWLGTRKSITFGGALLVVGHLTMALEGDPARQQLVYAGAEYELRTERVVEEGPPTLQIEVDGQWYPVQVNPEGGLSIDDLPNGSRIPDTLGAGTFEKPEPVRDEGALQVTFFALSVIVLGIGFLKPTISTIVGQLYEKDDPRRDPGYTLYYYGINLGSFLASIACGWLGVKVGWWAGFGAAGIGMLIGLLVFVRGGALLDNRGEPPNPAALDRPILGPFTTEWTIYLGVLAFVPILWLMVQDYAAVGLILTVGSVAALLYVGTYMFGSCSAIERERLGLALTLIGFSVGFWTLFEQAGSSLNTFTEGFVKLGLGFGFTMTAPQAQAFNAGFILLLAPAFASLWVALGRRDPAPAVKFGLALVQAGAGFLVLVVGAQFANDDLQVPLVFLAMAYLLHTTGELCLSPVGLSQMTKLAPAPVVSTVMAVWWLASAWAQWLGGWIAGWTVPDLDPLLVDRTTRFASYIEVFGAIGVVGIIAGIGLIALSPLINGWAHDEARGNQRDHTLL
jgi:proton-dependent oligopeptide transporter, POT family